MWRSRSTSYVALSLIHIYPVYYVKYAHARIMSIIRNLQAEGIEASATGDFSLLTEEAELSLIRQLSKLPEEVRLAADVYKRQPRIPLRGGMS